MKNISTLGEFIFMRIPHKLLTETFLADNQKYTQSGVATVRLNKALGTNYLMVWEQAGSECITNEEGNEWDWSGSRFYALRPDGELLFFWNTEMGGVDHV